MSFELASGAEARWTNEGARARRRLRQRWHGGEVPGTWSASIEWLVRELSRHAPELSFLEVRYRIKSWRRLDLCVEDGAAAVAAAARSGAASSRCSHSRWAVPSPFETLRRPAFSSSSGSTHGCRPSSSWTPLRGRRLAIVHGRLDAPLPGIPGVKPSHVAARGGACACARRRRDPSRRPELSRHRPAPA